MSRVETESRKGYVAKELWFGGELLPAAMAACYSVHLPLCGHPSSSIVATENESCSLWLWRHAGTVTATAALILIIQHICTPLLPHFIYYVYFCYHGSTMYYWHSRSDTVSACRSVWLSVSLSGLVSYIQIYTLCPWAWGICFWGLMGRENWKVNSGGPKKKERKKKLIHKERKD